MSTANGKDVVYIDIDEEITSLIDKVRSSQERIVALVLPKRATVLQSIVNMKLLKRTADEAKKHIVLITSEQGLLPLAGSVGLYVAKNLQTRPEVPAAPNMGNTDAEAVNEDDALALDGDHLDDSKPIGELSSKAPQSVAAYTALPDDDETIELDNAEPATPTAAPGAGAAKAAKGKKDKKFKIPDFNKFRLKLVIGLLAVVLLVVGWILAVVVLPHATISIKTNSTALDTNLNLSLASSSSTLDAPNGVLPSSSQQVQKTVTGQADATGQQNKGQTASGSVVMSAGACSADVPADIPAGTGLSNGGKTYITQSNASFGPAVSHGKCTYQSGNIPVNAQAAGAQYNTGSNATFSVAGNNSVTATSADGITGGTDNIVKVVQQSDIDAAKQKISSQDTSSIKQQLQQQLGSQGYYAITATFNTGNPDVSTSANAGDPAPNVTVTEKITYTMAGVKKSDLQKVIAASVDSQIDKSKQSILDYGIDNASYSVKDPNGPQLGMNTTVIVGSDINTDTVKQQVAGKKSGDAQSIVKAYPGVTDVQVSYSPFWVSSIPKSTSKITVQIAKPSNVKQQ